MERHTKKIAKKKDQKIEIVNTDTIFNVFNHNKETIIKSVFFLSFCHLQLYQYL